MVKIPPQYSIKHEAKKKPVAKKKAKK